MDKQEVIDRCNTLSRKDALKRILRAIDNNELSGTAKYLNSKGRCCAVGILLQEVGLLDKVPYSYSTVDYRPVELFPGTEVYGVESAIQELYGTDPAETPPESLKLFGLTETELINLQFTHDHNKWKTFDLLRKEVLRMLETVVE